MLEFNLKPRETLGRETLTKIRLGLAIGFVCLLGFGGYSYYSHQNHLKQLQKTKILEDEIVHLRQMQKEKIVLPAMVRPSTPEMPLPKKKSKLIKIIPIRYAKAMDLANIIKDKSNALLSKKGKLAVDARTNVLWLEDTPEHLKKLEHFIEYFDLPAQQILIEARLVNMNRDCAQDLGIRLGLVSPSSPDGTSSHTAGPNLGLDMVAKPIESVAASLGLTQAILSSQRLLDMELSALESQGKAKVISSPRLLTSNQIPALIESGEDIPYQEFSTNGNTSVAFKKAVLRLKVTPQITAKQELMMSLLINQDADSGKRVQGVPIISTKSLETHILVHDGQTIVLGGIYQEDNNHQTAQLPFLGRIPVLGELFQRKQIRLRHESLIIFITPRILRR